MADKEPNALVTQRIEITPDLIKMRVVPQGWELPDFEPGQFTTLGLPATAARCDRADSEENPPKDSIKMIMRAYSMASSSMAKEYLEFYIGLVRSGSLSPRLFNLKAGDKLWMSTRFNGMFTLADVPPEYNAVLIATGTGVAPYMSMIRTEVAQGLKRRFAVFHGARHSYDLGYNAELITLASISESFTYYPTLSHAQEEPMPWRGHTGYVQKLWTDGMLEEAWGYRPGPDNTHVFLCGNLLMIDAMTEVLLREGFVKHSKKNPGQIHVEQYFVKLLTGDKPDNRTELIGKETGAMKKYVCMVCGWIYDPEVGVPDLGIEPGTPFESLPDDFECPECGADKEDFEPVEED